MRSTLALPGDGHRHGLPAPGSFPNTFRCKANADTEAPHTAAGNSLLDAAHWVHCDRVLPATLIPSLSRYQAANFAAVAAVMTMFPLRSQPGEPEKMESDRPRVPWLSMH